MSLEQPAGPYTNNRTLHISALKTVQICILDEPSNFLDREALGGLAVAIRDWAGAVVSVSASLV